MLRSRFIIAAVLFLGILLPSVWASNPVGYSVRQVTEGVFYHQGVHEDASVDNIGAIANVSFVIGDDCVAVIDSGGSFREGELLYKALRAQTDKPVCYVINTHVHPDHILGNAAFKREHPVYVGHEKLPAAITAREEFFSRNFSEILGKAFKGAEFIPPSKTVAVGTPVTLDLGHRELVLTAYTTAHTDHDLTVYDSKTQTLWTGDLLFIDRIPALDGSINGWISIIEQLQDQPGVRHVIPGHGPALDNNGKQAWQKEQHYLTLIREQIRGIINDFGTIDDATSSVGLSEKDNWLLFEHYHRRNVTAAFVELEWE